MYSIRYTFHSVMRDMVLKWLGGLTFRRCMKHWTCSDYTTLFRKRLLPLQRKGKKYFHPRMETGTDLPVKD